MSIEVESEEIICLISHTFLLLFPLKLLIFDSPHIELTKILPNHPTVKKRWLSIEELAKEYGFSKSTQYHLRKSRQIPFSQIKASSRTNKENGSVRYDRFLIDKWLEDNRVV